MRYNSKIHRSHVIDKGQLDSYKDYLICEERSKATINKYMHDLKVFCDFTEGRNVDKKFVIAYKQKLCCEHQPVTVNVMLASLNGFFKFIGWDDCLVKNLKIQKESFRMDNRTLSKEEYRKLVETAKKKNNYRLAMIMETMASTGIRVSELKKRQAEGIEEARKRGVHLGRPLSDLPDNFQAKCEEWKSGEITCTEAAKACGMPISSFRYRAGLYGKSQEKAG